MATQSKAVATISPEEQGIVGFRSELEKRAHEFKLVLPSHIEPETFQRVIITAVQQNVELLRASRKSLMLACMKAAQDALLPDGREAALVIFRTRQKDPEDGQWKSVQLVQYMPMVFGLRKKILQSGEVTDLFAGVVYRQEVEAGYFVYEEGTERALRHKPLWLVDPAFEPRDEDIVAAYSIATFKDGSKSFEVMSRREINKRRQMSQTGAEGKTDRDGKPIEPKGPWVEWFPEQAKKTVIRSHSKTLPMSGDLIDVEADELLSLRSSVGALALQHEDAPTVLPGRDFQPIEDRHDPETGEVFDRKAAETKLAEFRKEMGDAQTPEAADKVHDRYSKWISEIEAPFPDLHQQAMDLVPGDDDRQASGGDTAGATQEESTDEQAAGNAEALAARLKEEAKAKELLADLKKWEGDTAEQYETLPAELQDEVDEVVSAQRQKLSGKAK